MQSQLHNFKSELSAEQKQNMGKFDQLKTEFLTTVNKNVDALDNLLLSQNANNQITASLLQSHGDEMQTSQLAPSSDKQQSVLSSDSHRP